MIDENLKQEGYTRALVASDPSGSSNINEETCLPQVDPPDAHVHKQSLSSSSASFLDEMVGSWLG